MRYEINIRQEPFQGYTQFDELELFDTELSDELQGETNNSSGYIKWVQSSLNRIMGLRLAVDGDMGAQTRSAIRSFQQRAGLTPDGKVGPKTEAALIKAGAGQPPAGGATPSGGTAPGGGTASGPDIRPCPEPARTARDRCIAPQPCPAIPDLLCVR